MSIYRENLKVLLSEDAHIDNIMKEGVCKVNWMQRGPWETTDLWDHPELSCQVKDLLDDLGFAHDNVHCFVEWISCELTFNQLQHHLGPYDKISSLQMHMQSNPFQPAYARHLSISCTSFWQGGHKWPDNYNRLGSSYKVVSYDRYH